LDKAAAYQRQGVSVLAAVRSILIHIAADGVTFPMTLSCDALVPTSSAKSALVSPDRAPTSSAAS
jgi:hypothetical protein